MVGKNKTIPTTATTKRKKRQPPPIPGNKTSPLTESEINLNLRNRQEEMKQL